MSKNYLYDHCLNWADEADFQGWEVLSEEDRKEYIDILENAMDAIGHDYEFCVGVGTNEEIDLTLSQLHGMVCDYGTIVEEDVVNTLEKYVPKSNWNFISTAMDYVADAMADFEDDNLECDEEDD